MILFHFHVCVHSRLSRKKIPDPIREYAKKRDVIFFTYMHRVTENCFRAQAKKTVLIINVVFNDLRIV